MAERWIINVLPLRRRDRKNGKKKTCHGVLENALRQNDTILYGDTLWYLSYGAYGAGIVVIYSAS